MKTAIFLSCLIAGGSLFIKNYSTEKKLSLPAYKVSTTKRASSLPISPVSIVIDKSNYELYVYDAKGWYATYPVVFGNSSLADKKMEGDKNTPEGSFKIVNKRVHEKWARYLGIDYPTKESLAKFNERKKTRGNPFHSKARSGNWNSWCMAT